MMRSDGRPVFIIAEAGVNHNGDPALAEKLVDAAVEAGADAVKFQTFKADRVISRSAPKADYQREAAEREESQLEMVRRLELSADAHRDLCRYCEEKGIAFISTPFDEGSVDLLDELRVPLFKIPSGEITHLPFLEYAACKGRDIILSTGMSTLAEVGEAVETIRMVWKDGGESPRLTLLHCVSSYPAPPEESNLRAMETLRDAFHLPVGFSDHTPGIAVALAAAAMGACVIEKHFTLDRNLPGPDQRASLEPVELRALVRGIRTVERALGDGVKRPMPSEKNTREVARRSLVAAVDIPEETLVTEGMLAMKRPGTGIPPKAFRKVLGRKAKKKICADELIAWEMLYEEA